MSVSPSMLDKLVSKSEMPAGNCTAWSMAYSRMVKCLRTRPMEGEMIPLTLSSERPVQGSTCHELYLWIWSQLSLVSCMLNKNSLAVKKVRGQSEATNVSDQNI